MAGYGNYDKYPEKKISGYAAWAGWEHICAELTRAAKARGGRCVIAIDCYTQVDRREIRAGLAGLHARWFDAEECTTDDGAYNARIREFVTDDRVFGVMNTLTLSDVYDGGRVETMRREIESERGISVVYGVGASLVAEGDILVYADLARWEIQCRFAKGAANWKTDNAGAPKLAKFKQGYFVEWRMADRHKKTLLDKIDYLLDTNAAGSPKMVSGEGFRAGLKVFSREPFRLVPYFAPEVWGGQWMKEVCGLDKNSPNYAWAFDGVPEENSVYMRFGDVRIEVPSTDVVFYCPHELLGEKVHARFGDEFPIRFDFLDTMGGQNLSLQVHTLTEYIQNTFGMHYTQDESYYILDCAENSCVYLGVKTGIDREEMLADLEAAQRGEIVFPAEKYVNKFPVKKHDHFLIPGGTIHCSGADSMVLEISATPYIFTFKLWDWSRLGLDGLPRPVHINHGRKVIQWDRNTEWVKENLVNRNECVESGENYSEERTGLHRREFIETRRCHIRTSHVYDCGDSVTVCNLVEGKSALVCSPDGKFGPFEVHYAETFIIPASAERFEIRAADGPCIVVKANVRG